jgi:hypothetical protein
MSGDRLAGLEGGFVIKGDLSFLLRLKSTMDDLL